MSLPTSDRRPTFDSNKITVVYVLGGPGAGKNDPFLIRYPDLTFYRKGNPMCETC